MKCKVQWGDSQGNPTPDDNDAIGVVWTIMHCFIHDDLSVHWCKPSAAIPICKEHARLLPEKNREWPLWAYASLSDIQLSRVGI